jgi:hypothetical protein
VGPPSTPNAPPEYLDSALTATSASDPALVNWWPLHKHGPPLRVGKGLSGHMNCLVWSPCR